MTDLFGVPLSVGDRVCYTTGGQGNQSIEVGEVLEIISYTSWDKQVYDVAYLKSSSAYRDWETDRKSTRLNSSHSRASRMPSSA